MLGSISQHTCRSVSVVLALISWTITARGDHGFDCAVDIRELSVAIRVVAAFADLLVGLATILQIPQQVRHNA
jgi:hypothetical protein